MSRWDDFLTERDRLVFAKSGYGARGGFGTRPVVLVIDVSYGFCGERPMPILDAIDEWHSSCGEEAWQAVDCTVRLVGAARGKRIPVIYATAPDGPIDDEFRLGRWMDKNPVSHQQSYARFNEIVAPIAPRERDLVILRTKPSAFFGSELASYLIDLRADTIITCGVTTSGCVRATVVDGFSYNYRMIVVEECTFDRGQASHWINLFDMDQKYADVTSLEETIDYIESLDDDLFADWIRRTKTHDASRA